MNQIFNSDERHGCVFVLGLDREVVAAEHRGCLRRDDQASRGDQQPARERLRDAIPRQAGPALCGCAAAVRASAPQTAVANHRQTPSPAWRRCPSRGGRGRGGNPRAGRRAARAGEGGTGGGGGRRRGRSARPRWRSLSTGPRRAHRRRRAGGDRRVRGAEASRREPTAVKRFDNAFRLQLYVANQIRTAHSTSPSTSWWRSQVGLAQAALAGPRRDLDDDPALLTVLDANAKRHGVRPPGAEVTRLENQVQEVGGGARAPSGPEPRRRASRRVTSLHSEAFLRVA